MKLLDVLLFVIAFCLFIIGIHQAIVIGMAESYWIFMFSLMPLFLYGYRKNKNQSKPDDQMKRAPISKKKQRKNG